MASMFTGIVQGLGVLRERGAAALRVDVPPLLGERLREGASIAVNGVCLTVVKLAEGAFLADLSRETASRTTLGLLKGGRQVNLELPVPPEGLLDGHIVLGHVDAIGRVKAIAREEEGWRFVFSYPSEHARYVVEKGSVAVDGISLTPFATTGSTFSCAVVPRTFAATNLQERSVGDPVNLEFDILGKYVEGMVRHAHSH